MYTIREMNSKEPQVIKGHAAVFNSPTIIFDTFKEQIAPGAFNRTLAEDDIRCIFNHDWNYVLGRNKTGTLKLLEDKTGLYFENTLPETSFAKDLQVSLARGDINQCSFGFIVTQESWDYTDSDMPLRTIEEVKLFEISVCPLPAYADTDVSLQRSFVGKDDLQKIKQQKELIKKIEGALKYE